jgi:hypothetical protein
MKNRRIYFLGILFGLLAIASCKKTTTDPPNTKVSLKNVYTLAGGGPSYADGQGTSAKFFFPCWDCHRCQWNNLFSRLQ